MLAMYVARVRERQIIRPPSTPLTGNLLFSILIASRFFAEDQERNLPRSKAQESDRKGWVRAKELARNAAFEVVVEPGIIIKSNQMLFTLKRSDKVG
jgi:hypothetical protein